MSCGRAFSEHTVAPLRVKLTIRRSTGPKTMRSPHAKVSSPTTGPSKGSLSERCRMLMGLPSTSASSNPQKPSQASSAQRMLKGGTAWKQVSICAGAWPATLGTVLVSGCAATIGVAVAVRVVVGVAVAVRVVVPVVAVEAVDRLLSVCMASGSGIATSTARAVMMGCARNGSKQWEMSVVGCEACVKTKPELPRHCRWRRFWNHTVTHSEGEGWCETAIGCAKERHAVLALHLPIRETKLRCQQFPSLRGRKPLSLERHLQKCLRCLRELSATMGLGCF